VIAYRRNPDVGREALAGGRADNIAVQADQTTAASLTVAPWSVSLTTPDPLVSGEQTTYKAQVSGPTTDFLTSGAFFVGLQKWTTLGTAPGPNITAQLNNGELATSSVAAPTVQSDTAVRIQTYLLVDGNVWQTGNFPLLVFAPSFTLGDTLFRRALKVPAGGLTVTF
jgi:hypothetical protein